MILLSMTFSILAVGGLAIGDETQEGKDVKTPPPQSRGGKGGAEEGPRVRPMPVPKIRKLAESIPSYRVRMRTKAGRKFSGIVCKDRRFHARVFAGEHHKPAVYGVEESFTLKFVDGLDGEIRLAWSLLAKLEVREVLDQTGVRAMEKQQSRTRVARVSKDAARRAELERKRTEEAAKEVPPSGDPASSEAGSGVEEEKGAKGGTEGGPGGSGTPDDGRPQILVDFPPEDGWGLSRKENLEWRRTVLGQFPSKSEQTFLDQWAAWSAAHELWLAEQREKSGDEEGGDAEGATDGESDAPGGQDEETADEKSEPPNRRDDGSDDGAPPTAG